MAETTKEGSLECVICGKKWVAVYSVGAPALECPECGHMNENPERYREPEDR